MHRNVDANRQPLGWSIFCPGCKCAHVFYVDRPNWNGAHWTFNGDMERPTFTPSMLVTSGHYADNKHPCWCDYNREHPDKPSGFECGICHSFVTDGKIQFLGDCTHKLAGQTLPLEPF